MDWKENLVLYLDELGHSDIEIYAWTNISTSVISKIRNKSHEKLLAQQFILLKLLGKKDHVEFLELLYGKDCFKTISNSEPEQLTEIGQILVKEFSFEKHTKESLADQTQIKPMRLKYFLFSEDQSITIEEISLLESAFKVKKGTLANKRFINLKLNSKATYGKLLKEKRIENAKSNERRKAK